MWVFLLKEKNALHFFLLLSTQTWVCVNLLDCSNTGLCHLQDHCGPRPCGQQQRPGVRVSKLRPPWACTGKCLKAHMLPGTPPPATVVVLAPSTEGAFTWEKLQSPGKWGGTCTGAGLAALSEVVPVLPLGLCVDRGWRFASQCRCTQSVICAH